LIKRNSLILLFQFWFQLGDLVVTLPQSCFDRSAGVRHSTCSRLVVSLRGLDAQSQSVDLVFQTIDAYDVLVAGLLFLIADEVLVLLGTFNVLFVAVVHSQGTLLHSSKITVVCFTRGDRIFCVSATEAFGAISVRSVSAGKLLRVCFGCETAIEVCAGWAVWYNIDRGKACHPCCSLCICGYTSILSCNARFISVRICTHNYIIISVNPAPRNGRVAICSTI